MHLSMKIYVYVYVGLPLIAQSVKKLPAVQETWVWFLGQEDPLKKEMTAHSSILAWRIPWTEEPGKLQSGCKALFISLVINCLLSIFVSLLKFLLGIVYSYPVPIFILGSWAWKYIYIYTHTYVYVIFIKYESVYKVRCSFMYQKVL